MKADHPIETDRKRRRRPLGGDWEQRDPVGRGRVQVIRVPVDEVAQGQAAIAELRRLAALAEDWDWRRAAVIARHWRYLDPVRCLCEREGIPVQVAREDKSVFWHLRETRALCAWLDAHGDGFVDHAKLATWLRGQHSGPWIAVLREAADDFALEHKTVEVPVAGFRLWLAEWGRDLRRRQTGLLLVSAHRAKGLEFDHVVVLDGGWDDRQIDAMRRLYYVAMTRARQTLTLIRMRRAANSRDDEVHDVARRGIEVGGPFPAEGSYAVRREYAPIGDPAPRELTGRYRTLRLADVDLGFAGRRPAGHPVHAAIADLAPGDPLVVRPVKQGWQLHTESGEVVGRFATAYTPPDGADLRARVHAVATWSSEASEPQFRPSYRRDDWEVVVPELIVDGHGTA